MQEKTNIYGTGIAQAIEARLKKAQEHPQEQPAIINQFSHRNKPYLDAWRALYSEMFREDNVRDANLVSKNLPEYLARTSEFMRPSPAGGFYFVDNGLGPGIMKKSEFIQFLKTAEVSDEEYLNTVDKWKDDIDLKWETNRYHLGIQPKDWPVMHLTATAYCSKKIYMPSPHMIAAALPNNEAACYLSLLDELEKSGEKLPTCVALAGHAWGGEEGSLTFGEIDGFAETNILLSKVAELATSTKVLTGAAKAGIEVRNMLGMRDNLKKVAEYFSTVPSLRWKEMDEDEIKAETAKFYSFDWVRA